MQFPRSCVSFAKRCLAPWFRWYHNRQDGERLELAFWERWFVSKGSEWPDEYRSRINPETPIAGEHRKILESLGLSLVKILDVGSGPLSVIGRTHPSIQIDLLPVDPLADGYRGMLERHGIPMILAPQAVAAEKLSEAFGNRTFDWVHAQNCIDHSADACQAIRQMIAVCAPGGIVTLLHEENEAEREGWRGFHRWNFAWTQGDMLITGMKCSDRLSNLLEGKAKIELVERRGAQVFAQIRRNPLPK